MQTIPPWRPQKAFKLAAELTYVTGITWAVSTTAANCCQQSSTWSMSAMSAIEQPAARSGRTTVTRPPRRASCSGRLARMSAVSAMKWTPQKAIARHWSSRRRQGRELVAVAAEVRQGDDFVLLIVMAEDQQFPAHAAADGFDPGDQLGRIQRLVGANSSVVILAPSGGRGWGHHGRVSLPLPP